MFKFTIFLISIFLNISAFSGTMSSGGIKEDTYALSCEIQDQNKTLYRLKLDYNNQELVFNQTTIILYRWSVDSWINESDLVADMRPVQSFRWFAGSTNPGIGLQENMKVNLSYFWDGPGDKETRAFRATFDASKRTKSGNYQTELRVVVGNHKFISGSGSCYAEVIKGKDPFLIGDLPSSSL